MDSSEPHAEGRAGGLPGKDGQKGILQPNADGSNPPTRQASNDHDACVGWAAKLYQDLAIPSSTCVVPGATISPIAAPQGPGKAAIGAAWTKAPSEADAPPRRRGANTRPTAALVAAVCRNRSSILLPAAGAFPPADTKPAPQRSSSSLIGRTRRGSTIRTTTENPKRRCVGRRSPKRDEDKSAAPATGVASTASSVPLMAVDPSAGSVENAEAPAARMAAPQTGKDKGNVVIPKSKGGVAGGGGASRGRKVERGRKVVSIAPSTIPIPEYDIYSSSSKSFPAECKRSALLDLATADMNRVNLERDFLNKDARFDDAKEAHSTLHRRWMQSTMTLEAACSASSVYFEEEDRAHQRHAAACRDRQAAEARVREAATKSAIPQTTVRTAKEAFHTAKQQTAAYFKGNAAAVAVKSSGTCEVGGGGRRDDDDDAGSSSLQGTSGNGRKRPHREVTEEDTLSFATVPTCTATVDRDNTAKAKHVGGGGSRNGEGWSQEEMHRPAKSRSMTEIHALSEQDEERHLHARGLQAQHEIRARAALKDADDDMVAEEAPPAFSNPSYTPPALEAGLRAVTSALAVAGRNMKDAIGSANRASADLDAAKEALDLSGAVRTEGETAVTYQNAVHNAGPYVSWVNGEVARQRDLNTWTKELVGAASRAWGAREEAREELNRAGGRVAMARHVLRSFSRGDKVDISRHALFQVVVEERRQRQRQREIMQRPGVGWATSGGGGGGGGGSGGGGGGCSAGSPGGVRLMLRARAPFHRR